jgi:predicted enzyme related to lactoylglutathione lyase
MHKVTGIGGFFFRANDGAALTRWYAEMLGVDPVPETYDMQPWRQEAGPTIVAGMLADSELFGPSGHGWAINFRVADLDAMVQQLSDAGVLVEVDPERYPNGRFASLHDPEGNPIQLWQLESAESSGPA